MLKIFPPIFCPSPLSNRTPAAGSTSRTILPNVLPATSPCHQGEKLDPFEILSDKK